MPEKTTANTYNTPRIPAASQPQNSTGQPPLVTETSAFTFRTTSFINLQRCEYHKNRNAWHIYTYNYREFQRREKGSQVRIGATALAMQSDVMPEQKRKTRSTRSSATRRPVYRVQTSVDDFQGTSVCAQSPSSLLILDCGPGNDGVN